jgi:branched-chain amino acid transport system permease protein
VDIDPIFGIFRFDLFGHTAYLYCLVVLFPTWLFARRLVHSQFGRSLVGIRENTARMHAIGSPVRRRLIAVYTISASLAGIAGALLAQTTQFVGLTVLGFQRSGEIVIMLVFGGIGRLYGAFVGAALYMIAQDQLAKLEPVFWNFWIGLLLVTLVLFARGGVLGLFDLAMRRIRRQR